MPGGADTPGYVAARHYSTQERRTATHCDLGAYAGVGQVGGGEGSEPVLQRMVVHGHVFLAGLAGLSVDGGQVSRQKLQAECYPTMLGAFGWRPQSQCRKIGLQMEPIEVSERLGRWSSGRGPLHVLLSSRLRQLIDEGELPPGEPLPPDRALAA